VKQIKSIMFDWDGTLVRSMHALLKIFKLELVKQGLFFSDEQIIKYMFGNWLEGLRYWAVANPEAVVVAIQKRYEEELGRMETYEDVHETLARLKRRGIGLGILALGGAEGIEGIRVYSEPEVSGKKPDPGVLIKALELARFNPHETLWVGNSFNDWVMGKAAGIQTVIFYPVENEKFGDNKLMDQKIGVRIIRDFKELEKII
jgi:HAD superfamily hydrolase (TIGR01509 family)